MSSNESESSVNTSKSSAKSKSNSTSESQHGDITSSSESIGNVASHCVAYDDEPLAEPGQNDDTPDDADGILPSTLEQRSDGRIPLDKWCSCQSCQTELLEGVQEYRCCKEMAPALRILTFDASIEHINCITQHADFGPMTYHAVLENVGPFLKDRNGRSYRRRGSQSLNQYLRAVAYRWLVKWMCGFLGWENTRPLPACVYNFIRKTYPTGDSKGYIPAEQR